MNHVIKLLSSIILIISLQSVVLAESVIQNKESKKEKVSLLFVLAAKQASIIKGKNGMLLTLNVPNKKIMYFSDRPNRIAGHMPLKKFVDNWNKGKNSFKQNPPNAVLVHSGSEKGIPLELMDASLTDSGVGLKFKQLSIHLQEMNNVPGVFLFIDGKSMSILRDQDGANHYDIVF